MSSGANIAIRRGVIKSSTADIFLLPQLLSLNEVTEPGFLFGEESKGLMLHVHMQRVC